MLAERDGDRGAARADLNGARAEQDLVVHLVGAQNAFERGALARRADAELVRDLGP